MPTDIRPEQSEDIAGIRRVHLQAFAPSIKEADLVGLLWKRGKATISLVAVTEGQVVAHVLFSPVLIVPTPSDPLHGLGLAPVGVLPAFQRQGIGSRLIERGLSDCRARRSDFVVVLGDPRYYSRFGFTRAAAQGLENDYGVDEAFMVMELQPACLRGVNGLVKYAPEFSEVGA